MEGGNELLQCLDEKIASGHSMIERLKLMDKIDGIDKLIRRIQQEIKFFEKVQCMGNLKKEHLQSSNLTHLDAMVARLSCAKDPTSVMRPFKYQKLRLEVDIVCNSGASWVKVIARNAKALTLISLGHGEYGQKSILDQANSYLMCSKCHLYHYRPPDVIFHFAYGIEVPLALQLEQMGIIVEGDRLDTGENNLNSQYNVSEAATLCKDLTKACDIAMPQVTGQRRRNQPYWWSEEIASLRREAIKCRRAYTRSRPRRDPSNTAQCLDRMRQARQALRSAIRIAKAKAWNELLAIVILIIVFFFYFLEVEQDELDSSKESSNNSKNDSNVSLRSLNTSVQSTEVRLLNLDVSSLLAYVTNMSNGYNNFVYREPLLTQQAEMERKRPIKSILENLFRDKELVICQTAYKNFMNIIHFIGGPKETQRALELLKKVRIVDDVTTGRIMELRLGGKIKDRSRLIFATGESMKSITVSANEGFVRAARMQGIECTVFLHEPRSLSEIKEGNATNVEQS